MVVLRPAMLGAGAHRDPVLPSYWRTTTGQRSSSAPGPLPHLYVTAFVQPISGETFWYISNGVSKPFFAALLALFAREAGAGRDSKSEIWESTSELPTDFLTMSRG